MAGALPWRCPTAVADETLHDPRTTVLNTTRSYDLASETVVCLSEEAALGFLYSGAERNWGPMPEGCRRLLLTGFVPVRKLTGHAAPLRIIVADENGSWVCTDRENGPSYRCSQSLLSYGFVEGRVLRTSDNLYVTVFVQMDDRVTVADPEQPAQPDPRSRKAAP